MSSPSRKCILVDGNSLLYRAFYAIRYLSTRDGKPTNALYGFANMLLKLLAEEQPYAMIVAFDAPAKTFRHEEFADYKATRKPTPDELKAQSPIARDLARSLGLPVFEIPGFEADDIVGTCARMAEQKGFDVLIVTGDLDELQLVSDKIHVAATTKGVSETTTYTPDTMRERYGLGPEQFVDFKALKGDTSDNIPGVPGVGDKTAARLIAEYGSLDRLLESLDELPEGKLKSSLEQSREQIPISRRLATIVTDIPLDIDFAELKESRREPGEAEKLFRELEFETLVKRLPPVESDGGESMQSRTDSQKMPDLCLVETSDDWRSLTQALHMKREEPVSFWLDALDSEDPKGVGIALDDTAWYVRLDSSGGMQGSLDAGLDGFHSIRLSQLAELIEQGCNTHDWKRALKNREISRLDPGCCRTDTMLAGFLLQPGRGSYTLEWLTQQYLGTDIPEGLSPWEMSAFHAWAVHKLAPELSSQLDKESLTEIYSKIEMPLAPVLSRMQLRGIGLDVKYLKKASDQMAENCARLEKEIHELAGVEFNIGSPKQLGEVLFEKMQLPSGKRTKTGFSTNAETLEALAPSYEIAEKILQWRELTKLKSTYADALPRLINPETGRLHTSFNQTGAATGRLSSSDPNLQNIPIKSEIGREIRAAFVAAEGCSILSADYSQIELRLLAHMSQDEELIRCFQNNEDIHVRTACALFGVESTDVTADMRRRAKTINFSVIYGKTEYGLSRELGIPVSEAHDYIKAYFSQYPRVKEFNQEILEKARTDGYVRTIMGRKRWFPELGARDRNVRANAERAAFNAPLQGSAADIIKLAMIDLDRLLDESPARMLLQVHDELVFDVECGHELEIAEVVKQQMESVCTMDVPLTVDVKYGENWRDMKKFFPDKV